MSTVYKLRGFYIGYASSAQPIQCCAKLVVHRNKGEPAVFSEPAKKRGKGLKILLPACV